MFRVVSATDRGIQVIVLGAALFYLICIVTRLAHFNVFQAGTGGFIGVPSNLPALACAIVLLWTPGPALTAAFLLIAGASTVGGFRIPRPKPIVLYTILAICILVAGIHVSLLLARMSV
jgi:phosphatidylserine synthase